VECILNNNPVQAYGHWLATVKNDWPEAARHSARRELVDQIGVTIPGTQEPAAMIAAKVVSQWGQGPCAAAGQAMRLAAPWAALVNGTAGHALDFDDNFDPSKSHATTVLYPAILALAEQEAKSGAACIDAYICGLQIIGKVGQGVNPYHRDRGWHATATLGAVGAAAACARLLGLDAQKAAFAVSLSTSMAAGFMSQFGTMAKPLHAGLAAKAGIMAACFARAGLTASMDTLDGKNAMNHLMVGPDYEHLRDHLTEPDHGHSLRFDTQNIGEPLLITEHAFRVKRFANCGASHRALDGLLILRETHGFGAADVERVDITLPQVHVNNLMYHDPQNSLEAKFSFEYALSTALLTGDFTLADFTQKAVMRPEIRALYSRIHLHGVDALEGACPTQVKITLLDGRVLETVRTMPLGSKVAPFSDAQYWAKFESCAAPYMRKTDLSDLKSALVHFAGLDDIKTMTNFLAKTFTEQL
jgi:2-methylcitrate dehydratase PrpD